MVAFVVVALVVGALALAAHRVLPDDRYRPDGTVVGLRKIRGVAAGFWFVLVVAFLLTGRFDDATHVCATETVTTTASGGDETTETTRECRPPIDLADAALLLVPAAVLLAPLFSELGIAGLTAKLRDQARAEAADTVTRVLVEHRVTDSVAASTNPAALDDLPDVPPVA